MKRILILLMMILCLTGCDKNNEETPVSKPVYVLTLTNDIKEGAYLVLEKQETISHSTLISFVLQDEKQNRYYIAYDASYITNHAEELDIDILKIIPGDTVTFSEDTCLISLPEDTK